MEINFFDLLLPDYDLINRFFLQYARERNYLNTLSDIDRFILLFIHRASDRLSGKEIYMNYDEIPRLTVEEVKTSIKKLSEINLIYVLTDEIVRENENVVFVRPKHIIFEYKDFEQFVKECDYILIDEFWNDIDNPKGGFLNLG